MVLICFKGNFPRYLCNIASEADLFLKIGVLWRNKDVVDKRLGGGGSALLKQVLLSVVMCHTVTSRHQSLSSENDKQSNKQVINITCQLMLSGETVLR